MRQVTDIDFTPQFDPDDETLSILRRKYNLHLENLYDNYENLITAIQDMRDAKERVCDAATNISGAAEAGDVEDIGMLISDIENELSDFESSRDEIRMCESDIEHDILQMVKLEKRLKFKPTVRPKMIREFEKRVKDEREY